MTDGVGLAEVDDRHQGVGVWCVCGVGVLFNHALGNGRLSLPLRRARRRIFISMKRQRTSTFLSLLSVSVSFLQISRLFDGFFLSSSFFSLSNFEGEGAEMKQSDQENRLMTCL